MRSIMKDLVDAEDRRVDGKFIPEIRAQRMSYLTIVIAQILQKQIDRVLRWLRPPQPSPDYRPDWEDGTCKWIFDHPSYRNWFLSDFSKPLWIYGIPGIIDAKCKEP